MPLPAVALLTLAVLLVLFGALFAAWGMAGERGYWSQRDPSGDPRREATPFSTVARGAFGLSVKGRRAPLRIAAIGVVMWWLAAGCVAVAVVLALLG